MVWCAIQLGAFAAIAIPMYLGMTSDGIDQGSAFGSSVLFGVVFTALLSGISMRISLWLSGRNGGSRRRAERQEPKSCGPRPIAGRGLPEKALEERKSPVVGQDPR